MTTKAVTGILALLLFMEACTNAVTTHKLRNEIEDLQTKVVALQDSRRATALRLERLTKLQARLAEITVEWRSNHDKFLRGPEIARRDRHE